MDDTAIHRVPADKRARRGLIHVPEGRRLFPGLTVAENIARLGDLDSEAIVAAAQTAGVHDLVLHLPQGYETPIEEGGVQLSGGQRQRIGLARAFYRDPRILVLDDALSAVDTHTEEEILRRLAGVMRSRTSILVSHRVSTVRHADQILVLDDGERVMNPGDVVVQLGNWHGWTNRTSYSLMAFVMMGANFKG